MRRALAVLLILVTVTGCVGVPTSGPVEEVRPVPTTNRVRGGQYSASGPKKDSTGQMLVQDFITAMNVTQGDYSTARQFLTEKAQSTWRPSQQVLIVAGPMVRETLKATLVGKLDSLGALTTKSEAFTWDFKLEKDTEGQWRVSNPPEGVIVYDYSFADLFLPVTIYFWDKQFATLVPDLRYWLYDRCTATLMVQAVLAGPSEWLSLAVNTAVPKNTFLTTTEVKITDANAEISLSSQVGDLDAVARTRLAAQLARTLAVNDQLRIRPQGLRLLEGTVQLDIGNGPTQPTPVANFDMFDPIVPGGGIASRVLYGAVDGKAAMITNQPTGRAMINNITTPPVEGLGPIECLSVDKRGSRLALVDKNSSRMWSWQIGSSKPPALLLARSGLVSPQFTRLDEVWVAADDGVYMQPLGGQPKEVPIIGLEAKARVAAMSIAPDGIRIALLVMNGTTVSLKMGLIVRDENRNVAGLRDFPIIEGSLSITPQAVSWRDSGSLYVLGHRPDSVEVRAYTVGMQAVAQSASLIDATQIVSYPHNGVMQSIAYTPDSAAYLRRDENRWDKYLDKVSCLSYSQ